MKLESNGVRTVIMHALMHTGGVRALPWRDDLKLGACPIGDGLAVVVTADKPWSGQLLFDVPRHRLVMGFDKDWPRMNTLPEWFTVQPDHQYTVQGLAGTSKSLAGKQLRDGLPVALDEAQTLRLKIAP
jgi:hypothetical protein